VDEEDFELFELFELELFELELFELVEVEESTNPTKPMRKTAKVSCIMSLGSDWRFGSDLTYYKNWPGDSTDRKRCQLMAYTDIDGGNNLRT